MICFTSVRFGACIAVLSGVSPLSEQTERLLEIGV